jgi:hypothetical protein
MQKLIRGAERLFPQERGNEAVVSLVIGSPGLAGGVVTIGLISQISDLRVSCSITGMTRR